MVAGVNKEGACDCTHTHRDGRDGEECSAERDELEPESQKILTCMHRSPL